MMKDNFTKIPNEMIKGDLELNAKELIVATILLQTRNSKDICIFSLKWLYKKLGIADNNTYSQKEIKNILKMFSEQEVFFYHDDIDAINEISLDINSFGKGDLIFAELYNEITENFTIVKDKDIRTIIDYCNENKIDTYSLLATYTYICSCINFNEQCEDYLLCYPSLINISENINITEKTVLKYINILKNLDIFVFDYAGYKVLSDETIKNGKMFYARKEDEERLLDRLKQEREKNGYINISRRLKDKSNIKRSIKQKINDLEKKNNITSIEIEELNLLKETYKELNNGNEVKSIVELCETNKSSCC